MPDHPAILKRFPTDPMCRRSENLGQTKIWCGMGWTGQPLIVEREGRRWAIFGAYDGHIHFMDAITGERILPDVETDDIIKGTPTMDPDGFPLVYSGSRDNYLRVIAIDRPGAAEVLYKLHSESVKPVLWNDDWDSSPLVFGDYLIEGSESSRFWVIKLNKRIGPDGLVQVDPKVVFTTEAWDAGGARRVRRRPRVGRELGGRLRQHRLLRDLARPRARLRPDRCAGRRATQAGLPLVQRR